MMIKKIYSASAFAGLLWNKQYYHYDVERWLYNDDGITPDYAGSHIRTQLTNGCI